ncbi:hypothetical protein GCM10028821_12140 [Hymenobacter jeollabukensis]
MVGSQPINWLCIVESEDELGSANAGYVAGRRWEKEIFYDSEGILWSRQLLGVKQPNWLAKLLNSKMQVASEWVRQAAYSLAELKQAVRDCINDDDDVLTQFVDADELIQRVDSAISFENIRAILWASANNDEALTSDEVASSSDQTNG